MKEKDITWIGSSKKDLKALSDIVQDEIGFGLSEVQLGRTPDTSKSLKGFGNANIREILADDAGGTYRAVYTISMPEVVFVLHVFQKKSKHGIETPKKDMDLVKSRLKQAIEIYKERFKK